MSQEYSFYVEIPSETLTKISLDTGIQFQDKIRINITHTENEYYISELEDSLLVRNQSLNLKDGRVHEGSLDIYPK